MLVIMRMSRGFTASIRVYMCTAPTKSLTRLFVDTTCEIKELILAQRRSTVTRRTDA